MKEMKNKNGFTLVELLAVIAILAILVIMALPAVLRMYRQSRINNFQNEVRSTFRTAQSQFLGDSITLESGQKILYTNANSCAPSGVDEVKQLDMTGNSNFKYFVLIDVDGKVLTVKASNGTYSYIKTGTDVKIEELNVENGNGATLDSDISSTICTATGSSGSSGASTGIATCVDSGCTKTATNTELTIAGENFYVVSSDSTNTVLLAKNSLRRDGSSYSQTGTDGIVNPYFVDSGEYYWSGRVGSYYQGGYCEEHHVFSGNFSNCANVYDSNTIYIYPIINSYAEKLSTATGKTITGRLMSLDEANGLDVGVRRSSTNWYWTGSVLSDYNVWMISNSGYYIYNDYGPNNDAEVRPVIIVSTSDL